MCQDNVLVFEYRGILRHLIGIQAQMTSIAKDCFREAEALAPDEDPSVRVRLICDRGVDKYDYNGFDE
jgi:hypothetical protein